MGDRLQEAISGGGRGNEVSPERVPSSRRAVVSRVSRDWGHRYKAPRLALKRITNGGEV